MGTIVARAALAAVVASALTFSFGTASAGHCSQPDLYVFTRVTVPGVTNPTDGTQVGHPTVATSSVGCTVPGQAGHQPDTNIIVPGANSFRLRYHGTGVLPPVSATVSFAGETFAFAATDFVQSGGFYDLAKWRMFASQESSVDGGVLTASICDASRCVSRTYRTVT